MTDGRAQIASDEAIGHDKGAIGGLVLNETRMWCGPSVPRRSIPVTTERMSLGQSLKLSDTRPTNRPRTLSEDARRLRWLVGLLDAERPDRCA
jgi:hypothetical protein